MYKLVVKVDCRTDVSLLLMLQAQPKHLGSYVLTGPVLAGLTEAYVKAINDGAVPTIATAWQVLCFSKDVCAAKQLALAGSCCAVDQHAAPALVSGSMACNPLG